MARGHLSLAELHRAYEGLLEDREAIEHLVTCSSCQATFDDSRWIAILRALGKTDVTALVHPAPDVLKGYVLRALSADDTRELERHLADCYRCATLVYRELKARRASGYLSPSYGLLARVRESLRPTRALGKLLVRHHGDRVTLVFTPRGDSAVSQIQIFEAPRGPAQDGAHPGSASGGPAAMTIDAGYALLALEPGPERRALSLRVLEARSNAPLPYLSVQLEPAPLERPQHTGRDGRVILQLRRAASRLRIGGPGPVTLEVDYAD